MSDIRMANCIQGGPEGPARLVAGSSDGLFRPVDKPSRRGAGPAGDPPPELARTMHEVPP